MEAACEGAADVFAVSQAVPVAIAYAVRRPERVRRLVAYGGFVTGRALRPAAEGDLGAEMALELIRAGWGREGSVFLETFTRIFAPDADPEMVADLARMQRVTADADTVMRLRRAIDRFDVSELISEVAAPCLVLHARGDVIQPFAQAQCLAAGLPQASLVSLDSRNHIALPGTAAWARLMEATDAFSRARVLLIRRAGRRAHVAFSLQTAAIRPGRPAGARYSAREKSGADAKGRTMAEAERVGRRGRGGGGAARRAERSAVRFDTARFIERNVPNLEVLKRGSASDHRAQCRDRAGGDRRSLRREPGRPAALARRGRGCLGRACADPPRPGPQALRDGAGPLHPDRAQPRAQRGDRGQLPRPRPGLRAALLARPRGRAALCHDGRFRDAGEAGLHVRMAAPFGRHCLRTDGRAGQQAPFRHALRPYAAFGQTLHGFGYRTLPRRRFHRDGQDPLRRGRCRPELRDDLADQHQLAAHLRRRDDGRAGALRRRRTGVHHLALHRRRRDGAGHGHGHAHAGSGRGSGGRCLFPAGPPRRAGDLRGLRDIHRHEFGRAHLRHARGAADHQWRGPARAPFGPALPLRRGLQRLQAARCAGGL